MEKTPIEYPKFGLSFPLDIGFGTPSHDHLKYIITSSTVYADECYRSKKNNNFIIAQDTCLQLKQR
jgi:hypothetical protein